MRLLTAPTRHAPHRSGLTVHARTLIPQQAKRSFACAIVAVVHSGERFDWRRRQIPWTFGAGGTAEFHEALFNRLVADGGNPEGATAGQPQGAAPSEREASKGPCS